MTDITASLFCDVHGEVTLHVLLDANRWECYEPLGSAGVCGETRDGATPDQDAYGAPAFADWCANCGAVPSRYGDLRLLPTGCPLCGYPLPSTAEEAS